MPREKESRFNPDVLPRNTSEQRRRAALMCAACAKDADDLKDLLVVLGLQIETLAQK